MDIFIAIVIGFIIVLGFLDSINKNLEEIVRLLNADDELDETWFEEPECPSCHNTREIQTVDPVTGIGPVVKIPCSTCQPREK